MKGHAVYFGGFPFHGGSLVYRLPLMLVLNTYTPDNPEVNHRTLETSERLLSNVSALQQLAGLR